MDPIPRTRGLSVFDPLATPSATFPHLRLRTSSKSPPIPNLLPPRPSSHQSQYTTPETFTPSCSPETHRFDRDTGKVSSEEKSAETVPEGMGEVVEKLKRISIDQRTQAEFVGSSESLSNDAIPKLTYEPIPNGGVVDTLKEKRQNQNNLGFRIRSDSNTSRESGNGPLEQSYKSTGSASSQVFEESTAGLGHLEESYSAQLKRLSASRSSRSSSVLSNGSLNQRSDSTASSGHNAMASGKSHKTKPNLFLKLSSARSTPEDAYYTPAIGRPFQLLVRIIKLFIVYSVQVN